MSKNNQWLIDAIKGEAASHTSIAFDTGVILERERIIKLLKEIESNIIANPAHPWESVGLSFAIGIVEGTISE